MTDLDYMACRITLGNASADLIQKTVNQLMDDGIFSAEFLDIIDSKPPTMADVSPPFQKYLRKVGIQCQSKDEAVWRLIGYHTGRIASRQIEPLEGLSTLIKDIYRDYDFRAQTKQYLGDSHDIQKLIGLYWEYDDILDAPYQTEYAGRSREEVVTELSDAVLEEARRWQEEHR